MINLNHQWIDGVVCIIEDKDYEKNTLPQLVTNYRHRFGVYVISDSELIE